MSEPQIPIPTGPMEEEPRIGHQGQDASEAILTGALAAAGVELGAYDRAILDWLSMWETSTAVTIASWIRRAARDGTT